MEIFKEITYFDIFLLGWIAINSGMFFHFNTRINLNSEWIEKALKILDENYKFVKATKSYMEQDLKTMETLVKRVKELEILTEIDMTRELDKEYREGMI